MALAFWVGSAIIGDVLWRDAQNAEGIDRHLLKAVKGDRRVAARRLLEKARECGKFDRSYVE